MTLTLHAQSVRASQTTLAHMTPPQSGRLYGLEAGQDSDFMSAAVVGLTLRASLENFFPVSDNSGLDGCK